MWYCVPPWRSSCFGTEFAFSLAAAGVLVAVLTLVASCANPSPPSGGPRDTTPPSVVNTRPVRDTVNVPTDTRSVHIEFSEYVDRNSLSEALSVTPPFEQELEFSWSGRSLTIELPTSLRDSTTYLFTIDTNLSDAHSVSLEDPIRVAFATGPNIDRGEIRGRVVQPGQGQPASRVDVYAYALSESVTGPPRPLPDRPSYRSQTGEEGGFRFEYMREQPYYVIALRDNNRNREPDAAEPYAVPPRLRIPADSGQGQVSVPWLLTEIDTLAPRFQGVQPLSRRRLRLTFDEPVRLSSRRQEEWSLRDSTTQNAVAVQAVSRAPAREDAIILRTEPMDETRHILHISPELVRDTLGQDVIPDTAHFGAISRPDTTQTRFRRWVPEELAPDSAGVYPLRPERNPKVRFNQAPDSATLDRVVSLTDTTGRPRAYSVTSTDGLTYRLQPDTALTPGQFVDVQVNGQAIGGPDSTIRRRFRRVTDRVLGELEGQAEVVEQPLTEEVGGPRTQMTPPDTAVEGPSQTDGESQPSPDTVPPDMETDSQPDMVTAEGPVVVEMTATQSSIPIEVQTQTIEAGSTFVFRELPEGTFRFRTYVDRNENGRWDGGSIKPYNSAEPITWSDEETESRPRWTQVLPAPLRIPVLRPDSSSQPRDTTSADSLDQ